MKGMSALGPISPIGPRPNSRKEEPAAEIRNREPATSMPPLRPIDVDTQPSTIAPRTQPNRALDTVQPERLLRPVSGRFNGSMKFASIELTAPEITAVS